MAHLFVSYSRVDQAFTKNFVEQLREMFPQHTVWYDGSLHGGDRWWQEILAQIAACDIFIYLLSNESVTSLYCQAFDITPPYLVSAICTDRGIFAAHAVREYFRE